jgi:galactokinase
MDLIDSFRASFGDYPSVTARAPGRVNLLGEHVDYNDGIVLPAAIDRQVNLIAGKSGNDIVTIYALDFNDQTSFHINNLLDKVDTLGNPLPAWALYPAGVAWSFQRAGFEVSGIQAVFSSNIPIGAGLSSSAAVEVGFAVIWQIFGNWGIGDIEMARLCQKAENIYVGVSCGLMDQFASFCGEADRALSFDIRSLEWESVPLPAGVSLVIADSGVRRNLTNSAYNKRRSACEQAVEELRQFKPSIQSLRDILPTEFAAYSPYLSEEPRKRAEHVVKEIARVQSATQALKRNDRQAFGALMYAAHQSLRDLYEVSTPELDALVEIARQLPGTIGARLTGAGFGGCTINLVEETYTSEFVDRLHKEYHDLTGKNSLVYICKASEGATANLIPG